MASFEFEYSSKWQEEKRIIHFIVGMWTKRFRSTRASVCVAERKKHTQIDALCMIWCTKRQTKTMQGYTFESALLSPVCSTWIKTNRILHPGRARALHHSFAWFFSTVHSSDVSAFPLTYWQIMSRENTSNANIPNKIYHFYSHGAIDNRIKSIVYNNKKILLREKEKKETMSLQLELTSGEQQNTFAFVSGFVMKNMLFQLIYVFTEHRWHKSSSLIYIYFFSFRVRFAFIFASLTQTEYAKVPIELSLFITWTKLGSIPSAPLSVWAKRARCFSSFCARSK